jgi:hypothetical protein
MLVDLLRRTGARTRATRHTLGAGGARRRVVAAAGLLGFAWLAARVRVGATQPFDDAVLRYLGARQVGWLAAAMLEVTFLGTGTVVGMIAAVASLFLALTRQRTAAWLLLWARWAASCSTTSSSSCSTGRARRSSAGARTPSRRRSRRGTP